MAAAGPAPAGEGLEACSDLEAERKIYSSEEDASSSSTSCILEFAGLLSRRSSAAGAEWSEFQCCHVRCLPSGLSIGPDGSEAGSSVPWTAVSSVLEGCSPQGHPPPASHPHVARMVIDCRIGLTGHGNVAVALAFEGAAVAQSFLATSKAQLRLSALRASSPGLALPLPGGPGSTRQCAWVRTGGQARDHSPQGDGVPAALLSSLSDYRPEDLQQPEPLSLEEAWLHMLPSCPAFQPCAVCLDKLGLSIKPLGKQSAQSEGSPIPTEMLNFPITALMDSTLENEFRRPLSAVPADAGRQQEQQRRPGPGGLRRSPPFSRASFTKEDGCTGGGPPFSHLLTVRAKGALAGRMHGVERAPAQMRLNTQAPPPLQLTLCFREQRHATQLMARIYSYKKYHLAMALSAYVGAIASLSHRESQRRSSQPAEDAALASRMQAAATGTVSLEPPPLPPRPVDLQPPQRLPRMVSNDEGEVFWCVPRKQAPQTRPTRPPQPPRPEAPPMLHGDDMSEELRMPAPTPLVEEGFDDDSMAVTDTPAPCLATPIPSPGRPVIGLMHEPLRS